MRDKQIYTHSRSRSCSILFCAIVVIGIILLWGNGIIIDQQVQDDINTEFGFWTVDTVLEQTFIAREKNLSRLDIYVHSYHPWDNPFLECQLYEIQQTQDPMTLPYQEIVNNLREVRHRRMQGWLISPHMFNSFLFAPIPDSQGKSYLLRIRAPGLKEGGTSILKASPKERYERGEFFVNGDKKSGDLAFRIGYQQARWRILQDTITHLTLMKPFPFSYGMTFYLLGCVYVLLLFLLFCGVATAKISRRAKAHKKL